ncbi:MAG: neutral/alkaline non-lysosomal ceramidase N-terminal domain-containing protein [Phycisphaerae bacterium]|nr:neutral/alkaline non-lysosomal ceramidase N-terminal domain-containing protein [Phycisphaerae bacterium]
MEHRICKLCLVLTVLMIMLFAAGNASATLRAGAARVDITPPVGVWLSGYGARKQPSTKIADPLYAKALVLDDGASQIAIVSTDLLWLPLEITNEIRRRVHKETGIARDHIMICGTHTHWGPKIDRPAATWPDAAESRISDDFVDVLTSKTALCIVDAFRKAADAAPAAVGMARGHIDEITYNRRTLRPDGTVVNTFRLPAASPDLKFGPTDPTVSILKVQDAGGRLIAAMVNYACHPVAGDADPELFYHLSADYPGVMESIVEKIEGGTCLFLLGAAGNINPVRFQRTRFRHEIGAALAGEVLRRLQTVTATEDAKLRGMTRPITFDLKPVEGDKPEDAPRTLTTQIQLLAVGDMYILGLPSEVLVEIGFAIRAKAGIEKLFIVSIANDTCGYICPKEAYEQGGYESTSATRLAQRAGEHLAAEALDLMAAMKGQ